MAVTIKRDGYGQVEPNHLSAPRNGQVYAQLPAADSIEKLEQGVYVKYDYANGECNFNASADGEWMLVFNEEKLYDERKQMHKHYAMLKSEALHGVMTPRVFKTSVGDIYTTNMVKEEELTVGDKLVVGSNGVLEKKASPTATEMVWKVVKETTMPDMQPAVKLQRVQ